MTDDRRLTEDYLPIQAIGAEASREKSVRKRHIRGTAAKPPDRPVEATTQCTARMYRHGQERRVQD